MVEPSRAVTIYDVADRAGVSKSLVSLVIRGSSGVSEKRRRAVQRAIDELGYRPSTAAAALAGKRTHSIGVLIDDFTNLWFVNMIRGMDEELVGRRLSIVVADALLNAHLGKAAVEAFMGMRVDGLVVATEPTPELSELLVRSGQPLIPTVLAGGRAVDLPGADRVAVDELAGARLAVEHLIGLGHRNIGHVSGLGGSAANRFRGYDSAMAEAGLRSLALGRDSPTTENSGYHSTMAMLEHNPGISAIFAANDTMAAGVLAALRDRGLSAPRDVSVVGFDNSPIASSRLVDVTTIDDMGSAVGAESVRALLARIADTTTPPSSRLVRPGLVERSTTGPVSDRHR